MPNPTMLKFGYPDTLVREFAHWAILVRPAQATLGSLILAARSDATAFGELEPEAFAELSQIIPAIETALGGLFDYDRINYLMLMMVDPNVHFHVIPRYSTVRQWNGIEFPDPGWPGPPQLKLAAEIDDAQLSELRAIIKSEISVL